MQFWHPSPPSSAETQANGLNYLTPFQPIQSGAFFQASFPFYSFIQTPPLLYNTEANAHDIGLKTIKTQFIEVKLQGKKNQQKLKSCKFETPQHSKASRNIKANILKDFIRSIKKDASSVLMAKKSIKSDFPISRFMGIIQSRISEGRYIRFKTIQNLCTKQQDSQFSRIFRTVFQNFVKNDYKLIVLTKKKNRIYYLKNLREMQQKMLENSFDELD